MYLKKYLKMYLKVPVPANKGTRLLLRSTNASHLLLLISEPRLGWLDHQHPAAAQPKSPWEHPPADHPHRPGSHQQSHCPLSSFQKLNFAAHFDQIFYLKHMRSPPKTQPLTKRRNWKCQTVYQYTVSDQGCWGRRSRNAKKVEKNTLLSAWGLGPWGPSSQRTS